MTNPDYVLLDAAGLNLQAVFSFDRLSAESRKGLDPESRYAQLILIGNGGRSLWERIRAEGFVSSDPVNDFSVRRVEAWLAAQAPGVAYEIAYPGDRLIGLQSLGELAGWHFPSPFMVGINAQWGPWFAYRAVVLANTNFETVLPQRGVSPCDSCRNKPCVDACPGVAMADGRFDLARCVAYRKQPNSACRESCLARLACPVQEEHRYCTEQIQHAYSISMRMIERYY
ncbi:MAG: hypothetical protein QM739_19915 [Propionivibrio sp.]